MELIEPTQQKMYLLGMYRLRSDLGFLCWVAGKIILVGRTSVSQDYQVYCAKLKEGFVWFGLV